MQVFVYALCEWGVNDPWKWGPRTGASLWRTTGDISDNWVSLKSIIEQVTFQVSADDAKVADSGAVTGKNPATSLQADLTGATWLRLVIDQNGDTNYDHTDWASPTLTCSGATG